MASINLSIDFVFENEGGLSNDANDPGGLTNLGITKADIQEYFKRTPTDSDVINLTKDTALAIYKELYWDKLFLDSCDNQTLATVIFDCGVNQGTPTVTGYCQDAVGTRHDDVMGPITMAAINKADPNALIQFIYNDALARYQRIVQNNPKMNVFMQGWKNRINRYLVLRSALVEPTSKS